MAVLVAMISTAVFILTFAVILAKSNDIKLFNRGHLEDLVTKNSITIQDIHKIESQRMTRI